MPFINWSPELEVGVKIIDEQHKSLVGIINRLNDAMVAGKGRTVLAGILDELIQYTQTHFATEESLMREHTYDHAPSHQTEHRNLVKRVTDFKSQFDAGTAALAIPVLNFLGDWLKVHIQDSDQRLGKYLAIHMRK